MNQVGTLIIGPIPADSKFPIHINAKSKKEYGKTLNPVSTNYK